LEKTVEALFKNPLDSLNVHQGLFRERYESFPVLMKIHMLKAPTANILVLTALLFK
jgi:hypothetical protein